MMGILIRTHRQKKYFVRILLTVVLLVTCVLLVFAAVLYAFSRKTVFESQQEANRKVLNQVVYNMDNLNETLQSLAFSSFNDRNVIALLKSRDMDVFDLYNKLYKLDDIVHVNPFLDSIWIYNADNGCAYTSGVYPVFCGAASDKGHDNLVQSLLNEGKPLPKLTLLPFDPPGENNGGNSLFAYVLYDSLDTYKQGRSLFMLAVRADWLLNNIAKINELGGNRIGDVFVLDENGQVYTSSTGKPDPALTEQIVRKLEATPERSGFFVVDTDKGKQFVTISRSRENGWTSVSVQSYRAVYGKINRLATFSIAALLVFLLLAALASMLVSLRLYKPVKLFMNRLTLGEGGGEPERDELKYIEGVYERLNARLSELQADRKATHNLLETYYMRKFMTESHLLRKEDLNDLVRKIGLDAGGAGRYAVVLLRIDDFRAFTRARSESEQKLCLFAITNIAAETVKGPFANRTVDMKSDHAAMLIRTDEADPAAFRQQLTAQIRAIQSAVRNYYRISLTAAISDPFDALAETARHYAQAQSLALRRMLCGKGAVITPEPGCGTRGEESAPDAWKLPYELELKLAEAVRTSGGDAMKESLEAFRVHFAGMPVQTIDYAVLRLLMVIDRTMHEMNGSRLQPLAVPMNVYLRDALEQETLDDLFRLLGRLADDIAQCRRSGKEDRHHFLVDMIKDMVELRYADPAFSIQTIADSMKMSAAYLGRCFRESEGRSVADWITEVRIRQAILLLEQENDSVSSVMECVGFTSESSFFKWFKKITGATPKEYRLQVSQRTAN